MSKVAHYLFSLILLIAALTAAYIMFFPQEKMMVSSSEVPVFIIDAGHGGADGGAVANDGTQEDEINLDIALKTQALAHLCSLEAKMTRSKTEIDYPSEAKSLAQMKIYDQHSRLSFINSVPNAVLISIHQNFYTATSPCGAQVFYGKTAGSYELAAVIQRNLNQKLCSQNRREAAEISDDIYLMKNADCPAVLIECGFLSNPEELAKLKDPSYRLNISLVLIGSCIQYTRGFII